MSDTERPQAGSEGIKELDEFLDAFFDLGTFAAGRLADGPDVGDIFALGKKMLGKDFRKSLVDGVTGSDKIPKEVGDLKSVEAEYLVEKFKTHWLPKALAAYAEVAAAKASGS